MPIVSKSLVKTNQQVNGSWRVWEQHIDALSRTWQYIYIVPLLADAITTMNTRDLSIELLDRDIFDMIQWVEDRNPPSTFDYTGRDIDVLTAEEEVTKNFARMPGEIAIKTAWWIEGLTPPSWAAIAARLGWSTATGEIGDRVQVRAQSLVVAEPLFFQIEDV